MLTKSPQDSQTINSDALKNPQCKQNYTYTLPKISLENYMILIVYKIVLHKHLLLSLLIKPLLKTMSSFQHFENDIKMLTADW